HVGLDSFWNNLGACHYRNYLKIVFRSSISHCLHYHLFADGLVDYNRFSTAHYARSGKWSLLVACRRPFLQLRGYILSLGKNPLSPCDLASFCIRRQHISLFCCALLCIAILS